MNFNYIETLVAKAKNGDVSAKEIIFKEFRPMILNISKRTFVHGYDFSDIEHECYATLLKCIKIYDLDKKRFVAYATMAIKNNITPIAAIRMKMITLTQILFPMVFLFMS